MPGEGEFQVIVPEIPMKNTAYIGLAASSGDPTHAAEARISNVTVTGSVTPSGPFDLSEDVGLGTIALHKG